MTLRDLMNIASNLDTEIMVSDHSRFGGHILSNGEKASEIIRVEKAEFKLFGRSKEVIYIEILRTE